MPPAHAQQPPLDAVTTEVTATDVIATDVNRPYGFGDDIHVHDEVSFIPSRQERYTQCLQTVRADRDEGRRRALRWVSDGGGVAATYCAVAADLAFGRPRIAGARLSTLAGRLVEMNAQANIALVYAHAGRVWHHAGEFGIALENMTSAMQLAPQTAQFKTVAARVQAELGAWREVVALIDAAEAQGGVTARDFALRGRAFMALGKLTEARHQAALALEADPHDVDGLLLRGDVARLDRLKN